MLKWLRRHGGAPTAQEKVPTPAPDVDQIIDGERYEEARALLTSRLQADPNDIDALLALARVSMETSQGASAEQSLQRASALLPASAAIHARRAALHMAAGRTKQAQAALQAALALDANNPEVLVECGLAAWRSGKLDAAKRALAAAADAPSPSAPACFHLGNLARQQGLFVEAERLYRRALAARPAFADASNNLGSLLKDLGRGDEALQHFQKAVDIRPGFAAAHFNLGLLLVDRRRFEPAAQHLRSSLNANTHQSDAQYWLGNALMGLGDASGARSAFEASYRISPEMIKARWAAVMACIDPVPNDSGERDKAIERFRGELTSLSNWLQTRRPKAAHEAVGVQQPYYLAYAPGNHREALDAYGRLCVDLMGAWARRSGIPRPLARRGDKCRLGIVSSHIHNHSVWNALVKGWVGHLDPATFEIEVFHLGAMHDDQTDWCARHVKRLHRGPRPWTSWVELITQSRLDVLVYPEVGMDADTTRLAALRLARVQLASWGHPLTTGLPTIDGFISALAMEPQNATEQYTEVLHMLPRLGSCCLPFRTKPAKVDFDQLGLRRSEPFLLCAGTPFKYSPSFDELWVSVAKRCQPAKLVFFESAPLSLSHRLRERLRRAFDTAGLQFDDCVRFVPWQRQDVFFGLLQSCVALLDTPGFSGFNTAVQAIECACPIVAWEADALRGRFASGVNRHLKLDGCVASDIQSYVDIAQAMCESSARRDESKHAIVKGGDGVFGDVQTVHQLAHLIETHCAQ